MKRIILLTPLFFITMQALLQPFDFTIASLNVYKFDTNTDGRPSINIDPSRIAHFNALLTDPAGLQDIDILCLQEWPIATNFQNTQAMLAKKYHTIQGPPYGGQGILSLYLAINTQKFNIVKDLPLIIVHAEQWYAKPVIISPINASDVHICVITTHCKGGGIKKNTTQQVQILRQWIESNQALATHWIICGDFNMGNAYDDVLHILDGFSDTDEGKQTPTEWRELPPGSSAASGARRLDFIFYKGLQKQAFTNETYPDMHKKQFPAHWFTDHALIRAKFQIQLPITTLPSFTPATEVTQDPLKQITPLAVPTNSLLEQEIHNLTYIIQDGNTPSEKIIDIKNFKPIKGRVAPLMVKFYGEKRPDNSIGSIQYSNFAPISITVSNNMIIRGIIGDPKSQNAQDDINQNASQPGGITSGLVLFNKMLEQYQKGTAPAPEPTLTPMAIIAMLNHFAESLQELHGALSPKLAEGAPSEASSILAEEEKSPYTRTYKDVTVIVERGDILLTQVTAIVNAANEPCIGGGGIDGVITRAGGGYIAQRRDKLKTRIGSFTGVSARCPTGEARLTVSGNIKDQPYNIPYVLQAVGPTCSRNTESVHGALEGAYYNSLITADDFNEYLKDHNMRGHDEFANIDEVTPITSIAFPAISAGIFGCTPSLSALKAAKALQRFCAQRPNSHIKLIKFMLHDSPAKETELFNAFVKEIKALS